MIKVSYEVKDDLYVSLNVSGHANYDDIGKDIVCSSVSSIVTTTINAVISIDNDAIYYEYNHDKMLIILKKNDEITIKLIDNMVDLLKSLMKDYPKNINVKEIK